MASFTPKPTQIESGGLVQLSAEGLQPGETVQWTVDGGKGFIPEPNEPETKWDTAGLEAGAYTINLLVDDDVNLGDTKSVEVTVRPLTAADTLNLNMGGGPMAVTLQRSDFVDTADQALWQIIRKSVESLSFKAYHDFIDPLLCGTASGQDKKAFDEIQRRRSLPFPDIDPYRLLKAATEVFMMTHCGVMTGQDGLRRLVANLTAEDRERLGLASGVTLSSLWQNYAASVNGSATIPYLDLVRRKLGEVRVVSRNNAGEKCYGILREKLTQPCFIELIWSYWHEEGMLVQTMNAISLRFQNRRTTEGVDPLATLELDPLRPLNNLLWGHIQDEQHRLTVPRRAYEYDHHYGLTLYGKAVPPLRAADSRSRFLEAFHNLLHRCSIFYKEDDDTTMIADPFPVLNALREVHLLLAEGAHNQFGDLPWTARQEMLMEQWLLARPEFREFLPTRIMVVYPEPWMDRVDAVKKMQGWTDTSVRHFRDLAVTGEPILLSIRFGNWSDVINRNSAANWARYWRQEVQWYIQAYQSVTGVDLSADTTDVRAAERAAARYAQPAVHLSKRLAEQRAATRQKVGV
jgi:hypothetical protein